MYTEKGTTLYKFFQPSIFREYVGVQGSGGKGKQIQYHEHRMHPNLNNMRHFKSQFLVVLNKLF